MNCAIKIIINYLLKRVISWIVLLFGDHHFFFFNISGSSFVIELHPNTQIVSFFRLQFFLYLKSRKIEKLHKMINGINMFFTSAISKNKTEILFHLILVICQNDIHNEKKGDKKVIKSIDVSLMCYRKS
jgi:hypothetical protein